MKIYVAEADLGIQHIPLYQSDLLSTGQLIIGSSRDKFLLEPDLVQPAWEPAACAI